MAYVSPATSESIIAHMRMGESQLHPQSSSVFKRHPPSYTSIRNELVQWIIFMSECLSYSYATVFSAVRFMDMSMTDPNLIGHVFSGNPAGGHHGHFIAAGCLLLGSKLEESDEREANLADFLNAWDRSTVPLPSLPSNLFPNSPQSTENPSVRHILAISSAERAVLRAIRYDVHTITPMVFADAFLAAALHILADHVAAAVQSLTIVDAALLTPSELPEPAEPSPPRAICDHAVAAVSAHFVEAMLASLADTRVVAGALPSHITAAATVLATSVVLPSAFPWAHVAAAAATCARGVAPPAPPAGHGQILCVVGITDWAATASVATLLAQQMGLGVAQGSHLRRLTSPSAPQIPEGAAPQMHDG